MNMENWSLFFCIHPTSCHPKPRPTAPHNSGVMIELLSQIKKIRSESFCPTFKESDSTVNIAKGITDPNSAFTAVTAVKGRVTLPKRIIFRKNSMGGGGRGVIFNPKIQVADSRPLNRALLGCFPKKLQHDFPIMSGGQTPFGAFPKNHCYGCVVSQVG